ncbi:MAG: PIG-L family deacetylase [Planctomycetota bacterium]
MTTVNSLYPPLADPGQLPRRVLVFAPHADDEILGCGGLLALLIHGGAEVRVAIVSDGAASIEAERRSEVQKQRELESKRAGELLGITDHVFLGFPDGALASEKDLAANFRALLEDFDPSLVLAPSPQELHPDHRAVHKALVAAANLGKERRVLLYGVNSQVAASILFDTTSVYEQKRQAMAEFASQLEANDFLDKAVASDRSRTVNIPDPKVLYVEGFVDLASHRLATHDAATDRMLDVAHARRWSAERGGDPAAEGLPKATAVLSTWNKLDVVIANIESLKKQTLPFREIVVVDNASSDGTAEVLAERFPDVRVVRTPNSSYGACETFNIGFATATTPLVAILDDDIELPPTWLEQATRRMVSEPASTAVVSTEVIEPGMPESVIAKSKAAGRRYMSTFRGCGSLAKLDALREAGFYDERLFIYGNERDLTCRLLNRGYRVLQDPEIETFHKTPFGIQMGKRSLYFHARNAFLSQLKYAPLEDLVRLPFLVVTKVLFRGRAREVEGDVTDATGTIGIATSIRETKGATWVLVKAAFGILVSLPYCWKHREPCRHEDYELPLG